MLIVNINIKLHRGEVGPPLWFLATDPEVPGSIAGPTTFSEKWGVWNGVHSAS
jgi:hypothetical protein